MYLSTKAILKYVYLLLLFAALPESNHAQLPISFTHYTQVNGLPDNTIKAIAQDKYGYIWIGTENGLAQFEGRYFTVHESSRTPDPCCCYSLLKPVWIPPCGSHLRELPFPVKTGILHLFITP